MTNKSEVVPGKAEAFHKAENIKVHFTPLENEIIPLGTSKIEVVLGEVELDDLQLDPANPRIQFALAGKEKIPPPGPERQKEIRNLLWQFDEVKRLKRAIEENGGIIDAIIVSGKDGTVYEGNCRLTAYLQLRKENSGDSRWSKIRARILPPDVTREQVDILLGELHIAGKNEWLPFEQAAHLYRMNEKGYEQEILAQHFRKSKSYISAKLRAYKLMQEQFVPMARESGKNIGDLSSKWSWFEEFYKKCKPSPPGKEDSSRVHDGPALEHKFCKWVLSEKALPQAADVRRLADILKNKKAIEALETKGIDDAHAIVAASDPALASSLWKQIEAATRYLEEMPLQEVEALRDGDEAKIELFAKLTKAVAKINKVLTKI
jgi:hypothetical protein